MRKNSNRKMQDSDLRKLEKKVLKVLDTGERDEPADKEDIPDYIERFLHNFHELKYKITVENVVFNHHNYQVYRKYEENKEKPFLVVITENTENAVPIGVYSFVCEQYAETLEGHPYVKDLFFQLGYELDELPTWLEVEKIQ